MVRGGEEGMASQGRHKACPYRGLRGTAETALLLPQRRLRTGHGYVAATGLREFTPTLGCTPALPEFVAATAVCYS